MSSDEATRLDEKRCMLNQRVSAAMRGDRVSPETFPMHDKDTIRVPASKTIVGSTMSHAFFSQAFTFTGGLYGRGSTGTVKTIREVVSGRVYAAKEYDSHCPHMRGTCRSCLQTRKEAWITDRYWHNELKSAGCDDVSMPLVYSLMVSPRSNIQSAGLGCGLGVAKFYNIYYPGYINLRYLAVSGTARMDHIVYIARSMLHILQKLNAAKISTGDLKLENLVLESFLPDGVRLCDMGSAFYTPTDKAFTPPDYLVTRWFRPIEVFLRCTPVSGAKIDMWGFGVLLWELFEGRSMFPGDSALDMVRRMVFILGVPPPSVLLASKPYNSVDHDSRCKHPIDWVFEGKAQDVPKAPIDSLREQSMITQQLAKQEMIPFQKNWSTGEWEYYYIGKLYTERAQTPLGIQNINGEDISLFVPFLRTVLKYDPLERISIEGALRHPFLS